MAEDSLILEHLKTIRGDTSQINERLDDMTYRLSSLERQVAGLTQQIAGLREDFAHSGVREDKLEKRVEPIERRLELRDDA